MSQSPPEWKSLLSSADFLISLLRERKLRISLAESCTGGLLAALLTSISGASSVFEYGWVCYSAAAKQSELSVDAALIAVYGVVSEEVAAAMAAGALARAHADIALSVTGNAGPSAEKGEAPVGRVYLGLSCSGNLSSQERQCSSLCLDFPNSERNALRLLVCEAALQLLIGKLECTSPC